jgi:hypothetical protein
MIEINRTSTESEMTNAGRGRNLRNLLVSATVALGLFTLTATARPQATPTPTPTPHPAKGTNPAKETNPAKDTKHAKAAKRRVIPVTISKGETYTISGLEQGANTESKAGKNPNALSVQPQPSGDLVLLGTEGGSWKIDATLASGEQVTFDVKVKAEAPPINSLTPGSAPTAISP